MWLIYLWVKSQQIKFGDIIKAEIATGRVPLSYLDAKNQVVN